MVAVIAVKAVKAVKAVQAEEKHGQQVPQSFHDFIGSAFFIDAHRQAERAVPIGSGALPAVVIDDAWAIVDIRSKRERESGRKR